jgi:hypothetical protein
MRPTKPFHEASDSTREWWSCPGLLYFLGVGKPTVAVKIGMIAITPKTDLRSAMARRLASIQSSNHELVRVLGVVVRKDGPHPTKDTEDHERELHLEFEHLARFSAGSRGAEWFDAAPELLERIRALAQPPSDVGIPETVGRLVTREKER